MPPPQPQHELLELRMKLTPLKVRGKKGASNQPQKPTKHRLESSLPEAADPASNPKRQRRIKPRRAGSAPIERLPLEVLEHIFLLSKNFNFPKSSPLIGRALSERVTLLRLVVEAFGPTWDVWFGCVPGRVSSYHGWKGDARRFGGDPKFQTNVLACGRVDVPVLLDAQKLWLRRQTAPRFLDMLPCPLECFVSETEPPVDPDKPATGEDIDRSFEWAWKCHGAWCEAMVYAAAAPAPPRRLGIGDDGDSGAADRLPQQRRTPGYFGALSELSTGIIHWYDVNGRATNSAPRVVYTTPTSIDMHFSVRIPDELLAGPWDWAKAKLLFWLVRQGTRLAREEQTWELTKLGYDNLVKLRDAKLQLVVVGLFCRLAVFRQWPWALRDSVQQDAEERWESDSRKEDEPWIIISAGLREGFI